MHYFPLEVHSCRNKWWPVQEAPLYRMTKTFSQLIGQKKRDGLKDVTWNNIYIRGSLFIPPNVCGVTKKLIENWWGNFSYFQAPDRKHWNTNKITSKWMPTERNLHIYLVLSRCAALLYKWVSDTPRGGSSAGCPENTSSSSSWSYTFSKHITDFN